MDERLDSIHLLLEEGMEQINGNGFCQVQIVKVWISNIRVWIFENQYF